ncbi:MAG TPA: hypothetical protein VFK43_20950 [Acidimicrobiales bacterium]|nr:hypothetical protein [Acidimicrobiales bacterium]
MERQLQLLDQGPGAGDDADDWRLDEETRAIAREGVAQAREALRRAAARRAADGRRPGGRVGRPAA